MMGIGLGGGRGEGLATWEGKVKTGQSHDWVDGGALHCHGEKASGRGWGG